MNGQALVHSTFLGDCFREESKVLVCMRTTLYCSIAHMCALYSVGISDNYFSRETSHHEGSQVGEMGADGAWTGSMISVQHLHSIDSL